MNMIITIALSLIVGVLGAAVTAFTIRAAIIADIRAEAAGDKAE